MAVNEGILPVPLAARPIVGSVFVQLNTVPATEPVKVTGAVGAPLQTTWLAGWFTSGVGLTVTVAVIGIPVQVTPALVYAGVMVKVTVIGILVGLVSVPLIPPDPLLAIPVTTGLSLSSYKPYQQHYQLKQW